MGSLSSTKDIEKSKRYRFLAVEGAGLIAAFALTPWIGIPVMGAGLVLGLDWFNFRAKNGMRF